MTKYRVKKFEKIKIFVVTILSWLKNTLTKNRLQKLFTIIKNLKRLLYWKKKEFSFNFKDIFLLIENAPMPVFNELEKCGNHVL